MKLQIKRLISVFALAGLVYVQSCTKYDVPVDPAVGDTGLPGNTTTINVGDSVVLRPVIGAGDNPVTVIWQRDGQIVSKDRNYTFKATEYGEFKVVYLAQNATGTARVEYTIIVKPPYKDGIFILNEGWFSHTKGSVNFWHTGTDTIDVDVFAKNNPGKELGASTQSGLVLNGKLYLLSKQGPLVAVDAVTMKETGRIETLPADARSIVALDDNNALLSTADGVYKLGLNPLQIGDQLSGITGEAGNMLKSGEHVFIHTLDKGVVIENTTSWTVEKEVGAAVDAFVESNDGGVWYAYKNGLVRIDPSTLNSDTVAVNVDIPDVWVFGNWYAGSLAYSKAQNTIYFLNDGGFAGSNIVYRYQLGSPFSDQAFITTPADRVFYSAGIRINPATDELVATTLQPGYGDNSQFNDLTFYNAATGAEIKKIPYTGFYFPSVVVFHEED